MIFVSGRSSVRRPESTICTAASAEPGDLLLNERRPMLRPFTDIRNFSLAAKDGEIGKVKELYFDDQNWTVRYVVVDTGGWLSGRKVLLAPLSFGAIDEK